MIVNISTPKINNSPTIRFALQFAVFNEALSKLCHKQNKYPQISFYAAILCFDVDLKWRENVFKSRIIPIY